MPTARRRGRTSSRRLANIRRTTCARLCCRSGDGVIYAAARRDEAPDRRVLDRADLGLDARKLRCYRHHTALEREGFRDAGRRLLIYEGGPVKRFLTLAALLALAGTLIAQSNDELNSDG